jgi:hypothetical protein
MVFWMMPSFVTLNNATRYGMPVTLETGRYLTSWRISNRWLACMAT